MGKNKPLIGLVVGILIALLISSSSIQGLTYEGKTCLALTAMAVAFWAFQIAQPGFTACIYLALLVIFKVAPPAVVFAPWSGPVMYLVIGAYLIAAAVKTSGVGDRIAYKFILSFVSSYKSIIISIFVLTFILSALIPSPWPRAFLIMSVMSVVIKSANIPKEDAIKIGFTVFAASVPVSMIFLTGDIINGIAAMSTGQNIGFVDWFIYMGPPNIVASILTCILILFIFPPTAEVKVNKDEIKKALDNLGELKTIEKKTIFWTVTAIILWITDSIHGIHVAWVTLFIAAVMAMPVVGGIITPKDWTSVPIQVFMFITAAMTIGGVGTATGMNAWVAKTVLPSAIPENPYILAAFIATVSIALHMLLSSVISVMGVAIPALIAFTQPMGMNPIVPVFLTYTAIAIHYVLPFHHLNMLVGVGEENGGYTQKETIRLGIPLTIVVYIICVLIEVPYWQLLGILK